MAAPVTTSPLADATPPDSLGRRLLFVIRPRRSWLPSLIGVAVLLIIWQVVAGTVFKAAPGHSQAVPAPTAIIRSMRTDGWSFYKPNIIATLHSAGEGWLWGNLLAIATALLFMLVPVTERLLMQVAVASYCVPTIAIGGVLIIALDKPSARMILAAISCYFTTLIGMHLGLRSAERSSLDLVRAYGGSTWTQMWKVRLRSSLPDLFAGLRIAAPAAMLGAVIGEYLGADNGLGVAMVNAQQQLDIPRTWGLAMAITLTSALAYVITAVIGNLLTTWAPKVAR